jgi:hypothetical protein
LILLRTRRSRPVVDASGSEGGRGGELELRGVGRWEGAGVVPGVESGGRVELYVNAEEGISESVSEGVR